MSRNRILYIQYTNPAAYPPLEHSSRILADRGWEVMFLGTSVQGANALVFPAHERIAVRLLSRCPPGWKQKLHYAYYCLWTMLWAIRWRPRWVYASQPCIGAWAIALLGRWRVVYHEHDSPSRDAPGVFNRMLRTARAGVAVRSEINVLPNADRAREFANETRAAPASVVCVWNCPQLSDAAVEPARPQGGDVWLYYHGSINAERLPFTVVDALGRAGDDVKLRIVGYETVGSLGYVERLMAHASTLGVERSRIEYLGPVPERSAILEWARKSHVGLALMPVSGGDINMRFMAGASNKPFDYMACKLPLIVSDIPEWIDLYVTPGYAVACDPRDADSLAAAIRSFADNPAQCERIGALARERVRRDWNYEAQFQPVLDVMERLP